MLKLIKILRVLLKLSSLLCVEALVVVKVGLRLRPVETPLTAMNAVKML